MQSAAKLAILRQYSKSEMKKDESATPVESREGTFPPGKEKRVEGKVGYLTKVSYLCTNFGKIKNKKKKNNLC